MSHDLSGRKIAILATDGFEQSELTEPKRALEQAGATTQVISPKSGRIRGWQHTDWGDEVAVDVALEQARPEDYDGLVLPGGQINPDKLRLEPKAVAFVRDFFRAGKPVGAICHGPWMLIEADVVRGRKVTSWRSVRTDLRNAGAEWVDQEVVVDQGLVTSRKPDDIPAFNAKLIEGVRRGPACGPATQRLEPRTGAPGNCRQLRCPPAPPGSGAGASGTRADRSPTPPRP
jgi:protease I